MLRDTWFAIAIILVLVTCTSVRPAAAQDTSTPDERARWVEITRNLEVKPLDQEAKQQGEWALKRIIEVHDVHVPLCASIFNGVVGSKYKYRGEIARQFTLASAAYVIGHSDSDLDQRTLNVSALESVLKTYKSILATEPKAKSKDLDEIFKKQDEGKLPEYVDTIGKSCIQPKPAS